MKTYTIITGATSGIGLALAKLLAYERIPIILACRNTEKAKIVKDSLETADVAIEECDLARLDSVRDFALRVKDRYPIDAIINNAGASFQTYELTCDGYEQSLATNCIAPAVLTLSLIDQLPQNAAILNTVSLTQRFGHIADSFPQIPPDKYVRLQNYSNAKLAFYLFTHQLWKQYGQKLRINAIDPGIVNTGMLSMQRWFDPLADIFFRPFTRSPEKAAKISWRALQSQESGLLFKGNTQKIFHQSIAEHPDRQRVWQAILQIYQNTEDKTSIHLSA